MCTYIFFRKSLELAAIDTVRMSSQKWLGTNKIVRTKSYTGINFPNYVVCCPREGL